MSITRLTLTDFRNHAHSELVPGPGLVVLTGDNGAGKTNVLEAVSLLAPGRGLRRAMLADLARRGGRGGFAVHADWQTAGGGDPISIGTGTAAADPARRLVRIGGALSSAAVLAEWLAVLWLTPAMDRLFSDGAAARRQFLDRLVLAVDPAHGPNASRYDSAMRGRNRLLADPAGADADWLTGLEVQMAAAGAALDRARHRCVAALTAALAGQPAAPFARPALAVVDGRGAARAGPLAAEPFADALARRRRQDAVAGRATLGPHRDDLQVTHGATGMAAGQCSTGEQKALLIAMVLAHAALVAQQRGAPPVLLLDEVAAHLDPCRRAALFERLAAAGGQVWLTGTEPALFAQAPPGAQRLRVARGAIAPD